MLLKPQTYMNDSGRSVGEAQRYLKIAEGDIYVFHDELDLAPGKLKVKTGGGNAGHNGLRSITAHIGNEYARVRIGIGHPGAKEQVLRHVLHDFAKADAVWLEPLLDAIADAAPRLAAGDDARFLTDVARGDRRPSEAAPKPAAAAPPRRARRSPRRAVSRHPAGERQGKRASALAENLKRWLKGRSREELIHGLQMRHRRPAQRRQVHPLQRADADGGGGGRQLSLLHHRAQRRRRRRARRAPRQAGHASANRPPPSRPGSPSSTSPAWCAAPPRARASATSSWPTSARSTRSPTCCAASRTPTSPTSRAASIRSPTPRRSRPS